MANDGPIILFDGVCALCTFSVRFILRRDGRRRFRFAPLGSQVARQLLAGHDLDPQALDSLVLIEDERCSIRSTGALRIARHLDWPWPILYLFIVAPTAWRDAAYRFVARHRYRWFGTLEQAYEPDPELRHRFLGEDEPAPGDRP